jgi:hypothetical protein
MLTCMQVGTSREDGVLVIAARFENPVAETAEPRGNLMLVSRILQLASSHDVDTEQAFGEPVWTGQVLTVDVRLTGRTARAVGGTISVTSTALDAARRVLRRVSARPTEAVSAEEQVRTAVEGLTESPVAGARRAIIDCVQRLASSNVLVEAAQRGLTLRASGWTRLTTI